MALTYSKQGDGPTALAALAPDFSLPAVDGKQYSLSDFADKKGLLVVFMCNHCPYVKAIQSRLVNLAKEFIPQGLGMIGINPNDPIRYPDDSFEAMKQMAKEFKYPFVYAQDITQETARAYDAVCTPEFYLYQNKEHRFRLVYHGRLDDSWKEESKVKIRDLHSAIQVLLKTPDVAASELAKIPQLPSMGCSIKWKE